MLNPGGGRRHPAFDPAELVIDDEAVQAALPGPGQQRGRNGSDGVSAGVDGRLGRDPAGGGAAGARAEGPGNGTDAVGNPSSSGMSASLEKSSTGAGPRLLPGNGTAPPGLRGGGAGGT